MCALFPPLFPNFGWPVVVENPYEQNYNIDRDSETIETTTLFQSQPQPRLDRSASFATDSSTDPTMVKKLNHNASERDRRKKINSMYSSLRSLLPPAEQSKKLSIPATVSHVLKYIPELQQQVEILVQKKEELLSRISRQEYDLIHEEKQRKTAVRTSLSTVSASWLSDREVFIQICTVKVHKSPLPDILLNLEEDGLFLLNASSFESFGGRVFHNLHLEVNTIYRLDCDVLSDKLLSLYEKSKKLYQ